jgi:hypothetical protein
MSAQHYCLVVDGELGPRYASAFAGMTLSAGDGRTEISGLIIDSAHLQGLIERVASLGLTLHSVTPLDTGNIDPAASKPRTTKSDR